VSIKKGHHGKIAALSSKAADEKKDSHEELKRGGHSTHGFMIGSAHFEENNAKHPIDIEITFINKQSKDHQLHEQLEKCANHIVRESIVPPAHVKQNGQHSYIDLGKCSFKTGKCENIT